MFLARLPSIFKRSHKMPHLPRNLHLVATWRSPDNKIRKKHAAPHASSAAPAMQNDDDGLQSVAPATKNATHLLKTSQKYCACHIKRPFHTLRNTSEWTYHRHGHMALRTVADGYERFRNVERTAPSTPRPPEWNGNPCYAFGNYQQKFTKQIGQLEGVFADVSWLKWMCWLNTPAYIAVEKVEKIYSWIGKIQSPHSLGECGYQPLNKSNFTGYCFSYEWWPVQCSGDLTAFFSWAGIAGFFSPFVQG